MNEKSLSDRFENIQYYINNPPQHSDELYDLCRDLTGDEVVWKPVCEGHSTPWSYIWRSYRIDIPEFQASTRPYIIAMGPRGGEKTLSQGKLMAMELLTKPNCKQVALAATFEQAKQGYEYLTKFISQEPASHLNIIEKFLMAEIQLFNGAGLKLACASLAGVNSKHCPKMRLDEVELIKKSIIDEAKMIPQSMNGYKMHTSFISTRKEIDGMMEYMLQEGKKRNYDIVTWCVKEMSEPCPEERRGRSPKTYEIPDIENPGETKVVQAYEGCGECPLLTVCQGDLAHATGTHPIDDLIYQFEGEDRLYFIAQRLCKTPKRGNAFFEDFSRKLNCDVFNFNPEWPVDLAFDFSNGGESPTVCLIVQEDQHGHDWVLAALYYYRKPTETVGQSIIDFCTDLGIKNTRLQIGDSAQQNEIRNLNNAFPSFFHINGASKIRRDEGWPLCRRMILDNAGRRRLHVNEKYCKEFIKEIEDARRAKSNPDDIASICADHALDAWRYREVKIRGLRGEPKMRLLTQPEGQNKIEVIEDKPKPLESEYQDRHNISSVERQIRDWMNSD